MERIEHFLDRHLITLILEALSRPVVFLGGIRTNDLDGRAAGEGLAVAEHDDVIDADAGGVAIEGVLRGRKRKAVCMAVRPDFGDGAHDLIRSQGGPGRELIGEVVSGLLVVRSAFACLAEVGCRDDAVHPVGILDRYFALG